MTLWLDAQLSPALAPWFRATTGLDCVALRDLGLRDAADREIYMAARDANAVVLSKDADFVRLVEEHGPPPRIVWITCGNTSNAQLQRIIETVWADVVSLLDAGEPLVEVSARVE